MLGCGSPSVLLVNAEVDSMGGVVEGGVGIACKTSPRRAAIERIQGELRQEYNVRDKTKRELEFLEKGGNPLDLLKPGDAASVSVQSTSLTNQHQDHLVTSEAKGSFAFTASPHGDSVESSGRLGANPCEPNSADNLMLFDGEHEFSEGDKNSLHPSRSKIVPSENLSQMDRSHRTREHGESAAFSVPRKAYKRRNRSRPNRDGIRLSSIDVNTTHGSDGSSLPSRHGKDLKGLISEAENRKSINSDSKPICAKDGGKAELVDAQHDMELGGGKAVGSSENLLECVPVDAASDAIATETPLDDQCNQQSQSGAPIQMTFDGSEAIQTMEEMSSVVIECQQIGAANKTENESSSRQINGISREKDGTKYDAHNTIDLCGIKVLDSTSSCAQINKSTDGNNDGDMCKKMTNADINGLIEDRTLPSDGTPLVESDEFVIEKRETGAVGGSALDNQESSAACLMQQENGFKRKHDEELNEGGSAMKNEVKNQIVIEAMEPFEPSGSESGIKTDSALDGNLGLRDEIPGTVKNQHSIDTSPSDFPKGGSLTINSAMSLEAQTSSCTNSKLQPEIDEDSILKEAQIIEAKRKRIAQLSAVTSARKIRPKSHWDYVLEEMAWLANDFAQERVWKIAAAAQISSRAAFTCRLRKHENSSGMEAKKVARTLAKSIMEFWHSVEANSLLPEKESQGDDALPVKAYAVRFLKDNNFNVIDNQAEVPLTPDRVSDMGILDLSWEDNLTEENLFYAVPAGAMETYKLSVVAQFAQCENIGNSVQEEVETSACDASADFESQDTAYYEDEGEISPYDMPMAFDSSKSSRFGQKKRKHLIHAYGVRSYEVSSNILPMQYAENKVVNQQSALMAKRPGGSLNVSIPTKRVRTASRRVISPFSAGTSGCIPAPNKTDASSGDTNSFQDDQTTLHGGSLVPNSMEVESGGEFSKQLPFHSAEIVTKHKKKKKPKHLNAAYEHRWQVDTTFQIEQFQRDNLKKSHQLESNGNSGLFGQPMTKKPKIMRPSQDNSFENIASVAGSAPSPVASQMSNMSNPNKFIKMLGGRDRGRKPKILKMPTGQLGSGSPWTLFEDQALVVLAHDLGPNWELVSDAINSTLQFKCIFRKAKECKERHNVLMDRTSGDGADSAEDSGSSQPYPSTLPGIPKGSARQLFQRLQGPMEEETLKSHFEKIIIIGQKQQYRKNQNDNQDPKQLQQPHSSHTVALSQVCPNNLNGGPVLTPLDICDATIAGPDILPIGYQGQHPGGLAIASQGPVTPMHPASGAGSALQGSPNMMLGNNFSSSPGSLTSSMRDGRYVVPRPASADEQQRMQQYNHMMTNRNVPQPNLSPSGALPGTDRGVRILPGGNAMGLVCGVNRSTPMTRPGFQGIASSSMVNSGSMVSPGIPSANMHSGVGSGQGSSMLRPREPIHMMRPGLSQDSQRQMMAPELQMQASPGNSQVPHFGGLSSPFPNQTASPPVSSYPLHHQPSHPISPQQPQVLSPHHPHFQGPANHAPNPQQQAYAVRLAKERQHRLLQQQQQQQQHPVQPQQPQFAASSSLMPHAQSQSQLPISPSVQNSSQVQPQTATLPVSLSPMTSVSSMPQHQQKHQLPGQGVIRNAQAGGSGLTNQTGKQRQRQQQQLAQANRQHPQQRQQPQAQQSAKVAKGGGRGSLMMHQNIPADPSLGNGVSTSPGNQNSDKGETFTNSALNTVQPTGQYASPRPPNQSLMQQKNYPGQAASSTKHLYQMPSQPDSSSQGHVPAVPSGSSVGHQSVSSSAMSGSNHQQTLAHQKLVNQKQLALQRLQPNRQINSDPAKPQAVNSDTDQNPTNSSSEMVATTTLPQTTGNATNVAKVVSSANTHQWHASEPSVDGPATNMSRTVSKPANAGESATQVGQELGQRPLASLPSSKHDASAHFQQHQQSSQLPHPNSPAPQQPLPALHSQQGQLLQAGKGNLYGRPSDHSVE